MLSGDILNVLFDKNSQEITIEVDHSALDGSNNYSENKPEPNLAQLQPQKEFTKSKPYPLSTAACSEQNICNVQKDHERSVQDFAGQLFSKSLQYRPVDNACLTSTTVSAKGHFNWNLTTEDVGRLYTDLKLSSKRYLKVQYNISSKFPAPTRESICLRQRRNLKDVDDAMNNFVTKLHALEEILDDNVSSCRQCYATDLYHWVTNSAYSTGLCQRCQMPVETLQDRIRNFKILKEVIDENAFECRDVPSDGNCLFSAVADQLLIRGIFHYGNKELREALVQHLRKNPTSLEGGFPWALCLEHESWDNYLARMSQDGEWGDQIALSGLADLLNLPIIVFTGTPGNRRTLYNAGKTTGGAQPIFIGRVFTCHYFSLRPKGWRKSIRTGPELLFINKSKEAENEICFPLELMDFIFHFIFGSGCLKSVDQVSTEKLHLTASLWFKGFNVVFVGSYINRMLLN